MSIALRAVFLLLGISSIGAFHPMHNSFKRHEPQKAFNLVDIFKRQTEVDPASARPCVRLAAALRTYIEFKDGRVPYNLKNLVQFMTSIDFQNLAAVNELVCHFVEDSSAEFLSYLRTSGIESVLIRRAYGYYNYGLRHSLAYIPPGEYKNNLYMLFQSGFTDLDPEGVADITAMIKATWYPGRPPMVKLEIPDRETPVTCDDFQELSAEWMSSPNNPLPPFIDPGEAQRMICDIFLAKNISEIQHVLDSSGILEEGLDFGKEQLRGLRPMLTFYASIGSLEGFDEDDPSLPYHRSDREHMAELLHSLEAAGLM